MSEHAVAGTDVAGHPGLMEAVTAAIRAPLEIRREGATVVYVFAPDLTAAEAVAFADLIALFRARSVEITFAEWQALKADLAALRTFRQQSQAEFMALTATQRDRALFDATNAQTNVLRALLRD